VTGFVKALNRLAAALEGTNGRHDADLIRRADERVKLDHREAEYTRISEEQNAHMAALAEQNRVAAERRAEWERVEREHMGECAVRYKRLTDSPELDPTNVGPVTH
jgi:hypothetical protein